MRCLLLAGLLAASACAAAAADISISLTDARDQPVADAVVAVVPLGAKPVIPPRLSPAEIRQEKQEFVPYVSAVVVGTEVEIPNQDSIEHHIYSQSPAKRLNIPLHKPAATQKVLFDQPGVVVLGCNIHDWMIAYVVVLETPWFGRTAAEGKATVAGVPPGRYRIEVWHPQLPAKATREVTVGEDAGAESFRLTLRPDRRIRRPAASGGTAYP